MFTFDLKAGVVSNKEWLYVAPRAGAAFSMRLRHFAVVLALMVALVLLARAPVAVAAPANIFTVAGTTVGLSGDGGAATSAQLSFARGVAVTGDGGFLIADAENDRVRKVSAAGTISTVAGTTRGMSGDGGAATAAQLFGPTGLAVTADGGFLLADTSNNRMRQVSAAGTISTVAGTTLGLFGDGGAATAAQLFFPRGVAVTADGGFLIADSSNNRVRYVGGAMLPAPPPPANSAAPTISGTATQAQTLTEATGTWTNSPTSFTYQWQDCDAGGANCSAIPGATGQTYALTAGDVGHTIRVQESATNAGGTGGPATSAPTAAVQAPPATATKPANTSRVGVASIGLALVSGSIVSAVASCAGATGTSCTVTLAMTVIETLKGGKLTAVSAAKARHRSKTTKRTVTVGKTTIALGGGQHATVHVALNQAGRRLLATRHKLSVKLTTSANTSSGNSAVLSSGTITFKASANMRKKR